MGALQVTLLGGFAAHRPDGTALCLPTRKAEALLAVLARRPGEAQSRERLAGLLWGDRADRQARHSLSQCLSAIRAAMADPSPPIVADRDGVALRESSVAVDVVAFERRAAADGDDELGAAVDLYRGPFLDGLDLAGTTLGEWVAPERARLHALAIAAALKLAARRAAAGDHVAAVAAVERALALDPLSEEAHRARMRLAIARGAFNLALRHYRDCAGILEREIGTVPEPATVALRNEAQARLKVPAVDPRGTVMPASAPGLPPAAPVRQEGAGMARRATIAVMPFADRPEAGAGRDVLAAGLVDDIITRLARLRSVAVIARGSVFALAERAVGTADAGRALHADYVVCGTLQCRGPRTVVTVELTDMRAARIVWGEAFDVARGSVLLALDEIGNRIVAAIAGEIEIVERNRALLKPPETLDAWEAYHRGLWHMYRFTRGDNAQGQRFFEQAVRLDPTFARAHAGLSFTHFQQAFQAWGERAAAIDRAYGAACQGLIADDRDPAAHWAMGRALWLRGDQEDALAELERAVELSPNFALGHYALGFVHCQSGDPGRAIDAIEASRRLSPFDPLLFAMYATRALAHARLGELDVAADWAIRAVRRPNAHAQVMAIAIHCLAAAGRLDEARRQIAGLHKLRPNYRVDDFLAAFRFAPDTASLFRRGAARIGIG